MSMRATLRVDPRQVRRFEDLGIKDVVLRALPKQFTEPWPIQKKMLALNSSGLSMLARSLPNTGKSTAAILGVLSTPKHDMSHITNLVLVPTPALADQYLESIISMVGRDQYFQTLYRNGKANVAADEAQHVQLLSKREKSLAPHTLIATPTRVLDYLSMDPNLLPLSNLRQLVVDELDVFRHSNPEKKTTLEVLLEYIFEANGAHAPLTTLMTSDMTTESHEFAVLPRLLDQQAAKRFIYDVSESAREPWQGQVRLFDSSGELLTAQARDRDHHHYDNQPATAATPLDSATLASVGRKMWQGEGLVICPDSASPMQIHDHLGDLRIPVVRSEEIAGLNLEDLSIMYVLGLRTDAELDKLKWMLRGPNKVLNIALT